MSEQSQETWAMAKGVLENGLPFIIRFREDLPDEALLRRMKTLIVISWGFEPPDGNGLPTDNELEEMENFEDFLDDAIVEKGVGRLMTVFTGEGVREWQIYTEDEEIFMEKFNSALAGEDALPLEIDAFDDENWDAYKDYKALLVK